ncbi:MAG: L-asparaginase, partial [Alphaproteobacteria bacterium]
MTLPKVRLFLLGGTITMNKGSGSGVVPMGNAEALCRAVPGLDKVAELHARTDHMIASGNLTYPHAFKLAEEIMQADKNGDMDGFV